MKTYPKSDEEIMSSLYWKEGDYEFLVESAEDKISKSGNEMIKVLLRIYGKEGQSKEITDYLLPQMAFKLKHFCKATGLLDKYNNDDLNASDCISRKGFLQLGIEEERPNENGGFYPKKNFVKDYLCEIMVPASDMPNDDVPF